MAYNNDSHITSIKDVESLFDYLLYVRRVCFHPDDDFKDYVSMKDGKPTFTIDEINIFNRLMDEAFEVCDIKNVDIYEIEIEKMWKTLELPKDKLTH